LKILDRYILTSYLKTFISVFLILMLIFVLQAIWLYISELAGKDLDIGTVAKFLVYITPTLIPLILPLTILLASIMVFGNLAENYEFAAMKSTGISLQRAMKSLSIFIVFLGITTFFFSNNVIPWAQYNSYNLRKNIAKLKPAMAIAEGQFNQVGDINIKVEEKSGDRGQFLKGVVIHKRSSRIGNFTTILSETGELISSKDSDILKLKLFDGNYYDELQPQKFEERQKKPFAKSEFETYTINVDLSQINNVDLEQKQITSKYDMLSIADLSYTIDSLKIKDKDRYSEFSETMYKRSNLTENKSEDDKRNKKEQKNTQRQDTVEEEEDDTKISPTTFQKPKITPNKKSLRTSQKIAQQTAVKKKPKTVEEKIEKELTILHDSIVSKDFMELFDTKKKLQTVEIALNNMISTNQIVAAKDREIIRETRWLNKHIMAFHDKFALALACIVLFFVGAPLGALIKKGGLGLPMVVAIVLFLIYHFIGIFAKNSAEDNSLNPILASWLSTLIMLPIGVYLTERATKDKGLFDIDLILQPIKKLFNIKEVISEDTSVSLSSQDYANLKTYDDDKLIDIIKNYRQYDYSVSYKKSSLDILESRGINEEQLRMAGNLSNPVYEEAASHFSEYQQNSKIGLKLYFIALVLLILYFVFDNNKLPSLAKVSLVTSIVGGMFYLVFSAKSFFNQSKFYIAIKKNNTNYLLILIVFGLALSFVSYFFFKKKMKEELKLIR